MSSKLAAILFAVAVPVSSAVAAEGIAPAVAGCDPYAGPPLSSLRHHVGALHEHGAYSDGDIHSLPSDFFAAAKAHRLSYLGSTEHSDTYDKGVFVSVGNDCFTTPDNLLTCLNPLLDDKLRKWDATAEQVERSRSARFLPVRGFEWTSDRFGHINVYFSKNFTNAKSDLGYFLLLEPFWQWFQRHPDVPGVGGTVTAPVPFGGGGDGLAHFNHPSDKCLPGLIEADPGCDWFDYEYVAGADERMFGLELFNTDGGRDYYVEGYLRALERGWHVGAIGSEDTHDATWAQPQHAKTVTLMPALGEAELRAAWLARRTYALADASAPRFQTFEAGGHPMGARMACDAGARVPLRVRVRNPDGTAFAGSIELVTTGGQVAARVDGPLLRTHVAAPAASAGEGWWFVRVRDAGGDSVTYSSPVWIRGR